MSENEALSEREVARRQILDALGLQDYTKAKRAKLLKTIEDLVTMLWEQDTQAHANKSTINNMSAEIQAQKNRADNAARERDNLARSNSKNATRRLGYETAMKDALTALGLGLRG